MKITQKQKKADLRKGRAERAVKNGSATSPKGNRIVMSDGRTYLGAPPKFAAVRNGLGLVVHFKKVANGIPFVRMW